ncbi:MAG: hypothetical protein RLZZ299_2374 [Pseudomonadota bacterium]
MSPSGVFRPDALDAGVAVLASWGYRPERMPGVGASSRYLAGEDDVRRADLEAAFSGDWDAVWMARGGYGLTRLLADLDPGCLAPVPFLGFSDGTALLDPLAARGRPAVHAPVLTSLASHVDDASRAHLRALLAGEGCAPLVGAPLWGPSQVVQGPLRGGNLCMLASLCGTPWQPRLQGAILLLEEVGEAPYRVDRMVTQLRAAGVLDGVRGVALGTFTGSAAPDGAGWSMDDVLRDLFAPLGVPVVAGLPVGHGAANRAVPLGRAARLEAGVLTVQA